MYRCFDKEKYQSLIRLSKLRTAIDIVHTLQLPDIIALEDALEFGCPRGRLFTALRFGLYEFQPMSYTTIAKLHEITDERVRQLIHVTLWRTKERLDKYPHYRWYHDLRKYDRLEVYNDIYTVKPISFERPHERDY